MRIVPYPVKDGRFHYIRDSVPIVCPHFIYRQWVQCLPAVHLHNNLMHSQTLSFLQ